MTRPGVVMVTGAYPPETSGAALQCQALLRTLGDRVDAAVLTTTAAAGRGPAVVDGIPVHRVPVRIGAPGSEARAAAGLALGLLRLARGRSIVHFHGFSRKSVLLMTLARVLGRRRIVKLTSVGHDDPVTVRAHGGLAASVYRSADVYVAMSPRQRELCREAGIDPARVWLIPNGVDVGRFRTATAAERAALRQALELPAEEPVVLFVGFFSQDKQPHVLFDAWRALGARGGALVFVGATRSDYYEIDHALAERLRDEVRRTGARVRFVERADAIEQYYRAADVFALPSRREGLPNALLEAMASGLACVASCLPGVTDAIVDHGVTGVLVPPEDPRALSAALDDLLGDAAVRARLGAAARETVTQRYDLTATAAAHLDLYASLGRPPRRARAQH